MSRATNIYSQFHRWRLKYLSETGFITVLPILVGVLAGIAAVLLKNTRVFTKNRKQIIDVSHV